MVVQPLIFAHVRRSQYRRQTLTYQSATSGRPSAFLRLLLLFEREGPTFFAEHPPRRGRSVSAIACLLLGIATHCAAVDLIKCDNGADSTLGHAAPSEVTTTRSQSVARTTVAATTRTLASSYTPEDSSRVRLLVNSSDVGKRQRMLQQVNVELALEEVDKNENIVPSPAEKARQRQAIGKGSVAVAADW